MLATSKLPLPRSLCPRRRPKSCQAQLALLGRFGDILEARGRDAIVNSTQIEYAYTDKFRFRSTKAASELGYTYGPLEPAIRDALEWFRKNDML